MEEEGGLLNNLNLSEKIQFKIMKQNTLFQVTLYCRVECPIYNDNLKSFVLSVINEPYVSLFALVLLFLLAHLHARKVISSKLLIRFRLNGTLVNRTCPSSNKNHLKLKRHSFETQGCVFFSKKGKFFVS